MFKNRLVTNSYVCVCIVCDCDFCGTKECDHQTGQCLCRENIVGEKCDRCADNHYGFSTCNVPIRLVDFSSYFFTIQLLMRLYFQGCTACNCANASLSSQCDDLTGSCRCKDGVVGQICDRCAAGYWKYSDSGCTCKQHLDQDLFNRHQFISRRLRYYY